jgi:hypothetical protein
MQTPWTGDLDGMVERRIIRVLTVNSKTFYFHDKGTQRGTVVDFFRLFEDELNKKRAADKTLKNRAEGRTGCLVLRLPGGDRPEADAVARPGEQARRVPRRRQGSFVRRISRIGSTTGRTPRRSKTVSHWPASGWPQPLRRLLDGQARAPGVSGSPVRLWHQLAAAPDSLTCRVTCPAICAAVCWTWRPPRGRE